MVFPQYRKSFDEKSFYKITSLTTFEEVQLIGKRFFIYDVHAKKYFEQLKVQEMLNTDIGLFQTSNEEEFERFYKTAKEYILTKKGEV